eukprot:TRINITY_DN31914_c0_g1_i1.p1 TRINITY_DN31914_c0_g1~~TRINITY_DN31914_c0_g1_i1.p1  ORF type:complete len:131 (-),score=30.71 TRINITY_DN31914_c0_g1_i1:69-404(-)
MLRAIFNRTSLTRAPKMLCSPRFAPSRAFASDVNESRDSFKDREQAMENAAVRRASEEARRKYLEKMNGQEQLKTIDSKLPDQKDQHIDIEDTPVNSHKSNAHLGNSGFIA